MALFRQRLGFTNRFILGVSLSFCFLSNTAQTETNDLSLGDILDLKITTASKKEESVFETPLSGTVITRSDILNSGATNIPEALRLVPGALVREKTNGNYGIDLRGMSGLAPKTSLYSWDNGSTLVMIDNRIVFNYFSGAVFWESLPIHLNDVERIEIVRGPSTALYGPNAVDGVIHIITRKPSQEGISASTDIKAGNHDNQTGQASLSYKSSEKWNATFTVNGEKRERQQTSYFDFYSNQRVARNTDLNNFCIIPTGCEYFMIGAAVPVITQILIANGVPPAMAPAMALAQAQALYPAGSVPAGSLISKYPAAFASPSLPEDHTELAQQKFGANTFIQFKPNSDMTFELQGGIQSSHVQRDWDSGITSLGHYKSQSQYVDGKFKGHNISAHTAFLQGDQDLLGWITGGSTFQRDFTNFDSEIEYDLKLSNLLLRPGLWYRKAVYEGTYIGGKRELEQRAISLRSEYTLDQWKFVFAGRLDDNNIPNNAYFSFQNAITKSFNESNMLRLVYSRANKTPALTDAYTSFYEPNFNLRYEANPGLKLKIMDTAEVGYRKKIKPNLILDTDVFMNYARNFANLGPIAVTPTLTTEGKRIFINNSAKAREVGLTGNLNYIHSTDLKTQVYSTLQQTKIVSKPFGSGTEYKATPSLFGGLIVNYRPFERFNVNFNPYFFSGATYTHDSVANNLASDVQKVDGKFLMNLNLSYEIKPQMRISLDGRNILNDKSTEYPYMDEAGAYYFVGFNADI